MADKNSQSDPFSKGAAARRLGEGARAKNGSKPSQSVKPPTSGPSGGAGDSGASKK